MTQQHAEQVIADLWDPQDPEDWATSESTHARRYLAHLVNGTNMRPVESLSVSVRRQIEERVQQELAKPEPEVAE